MIGADVAALVRIQEGRAPVLIEAGRSAAKRYLRRNLRASYVDASSWNPAFELNWIIASSGATSRRVAFFGRGRYLGTDFDFGNLGQLGQPGPLSQRIGLRCTNRAGHGFFLSRDRWRKF